MRHVRNADVFYFLFFSCCCFFLLFFHFFFSFPTRISFFLIVYCLGKYQGKGQKEGGGGGGEREREEEEGVVALRVLFEWRQKRKRRHLRSHVQKIIQDIFLMLVMQGFIHASDSSVSDLC